MLAAVLLIACGGDDEKTVTIRGDDGEDIQATVRVEDDGDEVSISTEEGDVFANLGGDLVDGYPSELIYPGAALTFSAATEVEGNQQFVAFWETDDDADTVLDFYERAFDALGIQGEKERASFGGIATLNVGPEDAGAAVIFDEGSGEGGANVVSLTNAPPAPSGLCKPHSPTAQGTVARRVRLDLQRHAGVEREPELRPAAAAIHHHPHPHRFTPGGADRRERRPHRPARREHIVDDQRALATPERESPPEASAGALRVTLREVRLGAQRSRRLVRHDDPARRRPRHHLHPRIAEPLGDLPAQPCGDLGIFQQPELLDVNLAVAAGRVLEVPREERAGLPKQAARLGVPAHGERTRNSDGSSASSMSSLPQPPI